MKFGREYLNIAEAGNDQQITNRWQYCGVRGSHVASYVSEITYVNFGNFYRKLVLYIIPILTCKLSKYVLMNHI